MVGPLSLRERARVRASALNPDIKKGRTLPRRRPRKILNTVNPPSSQLTAPDRFLCKAVAS